MQNENFPDEDLDKAFDEDVPLEARVIKAIGRSAYLVSLNGRLANLKSDKRWQPDSTLRVHVVNIRADNGYVYVSEVDSVEPEPQLLARQERLLASLEVGHDYIGTITRIVDYGLFVTVRGFAGLVHRTELSWLSKSPLPTSLGFGIGQRVSVRILKIDIERMRLLLSIKETQPDPFLAFADAYALDPSRIFHCIVRKTTNYGVFLEVSGGIDALLHASKLGIAPGKKGGFQLTEVQQTMLMKLRRIPVRVSDVSSEKRRVAVDLALTKNPFGMPNPQMSIGDIVFGELVAHDRRRTTVKLSNGDLGFVHVEDDDLLFFRLGLHSSPGERMEYQFLGVDFVSGEIRLRPVFADSFNESEHDYILTNYVSNLSHLDFDKSQQFPNRYDVLARHLNIIAAARLTRKFDYIYHFGLVSSDPAIQSFGLAHRASIEFKLGRPELALSFLRLALRTAVQVRSRMLVKSIKSIIQKNSSTIWPEEQG